MPFGFFFETDGIYIDRFRQNELKEGAQRSVGKQYYYIDYEHFCNVVKWRVAKMRHIIDETLRNVRLFKDTLLASYHLWL